MVYYLDDFESKMLLKSLRPKAREVGVTEDLRGWNWNTSPLRPYYDVQLPMFLVSSTYCPTARDVYLNRVKRERGTWNHYVTMGKIIHDTVSESFQCARSLEFGKAFSEWYSRDPYLDYPGNFDEIEKYALMTWEFILSISKAKVDSMATAQPYSKLQDIILTSMPFLIEHRVDGRLLGTSGMLSVDCFDYMRNIMFDLKVGFRGQKEKCRLFPTGYALVFESVYEVPVDIGCVVFLNFKNDRMIIERDLFHINDDLRSWWIEERDKKAEIVSEERDPGMPSSCPPECIYHSVCGE